MPFRTTLYPLLAQTTMINAGPVAALCQHLVLGISDQPAGCRNLLAQLQRCLAAAVLTTSANLWLLCIESREHLIRCPADPVGHPV